MTTYFASQTGAGSYNGSSPAHAWDVGNISWSSVNSNDTLFLLDTITSTISITKDFEETGPLWLRGDYTSRECIMDGQSTLPVLIQAPYRGYSGYKLQGITFDNVASSVANRATYFNCISNLDIIDCHFPNTNNSLAAALYMSTTANVGIANLNISSNTFIKSNIQIEISTTESVGLCSNIRITDNDATDCTDFIQFIFSDLNTHLYRMYPIGLNILNNKLTNCPNGLSNVGWVNGSGVSASSVAYNTLINSGDIHLISSQGGRVHNNNLTTGKISLDGVDYPSEQVVVNANSLDDGELELRWADNCDAYCNIIDKGNLGVITIVCDNTRVYNNLFRDINQIALAVGPSTRGLVFKNNILMRCVETYYKHISAEVPDWDYNGCYYNALSSHPPGLHDINSPGAIGVDNKLSPNSNYQGMGTNEFAPTVDFEGKDFEIYHIGPYATLSTEVELSFNTADLTWLESSPNAWVDYPTTSWNSARTYLHYLDVIVATGVEPVVSDTKIMSRDYAEAFSLGDVFTNPTVQKLSESLGIADTSITHSILKNLEEEFNILSKFQRILVIDLTSRLAISFHLEDADFIGTHYYIPGLEEFIGIIDDMATNYALNIDEYLDILSDYVRSTANGTVSTIFITGNPFTNKDEFLDTALNGHLPDYEKFSTFIQGNYEYQKALFRTTMAPTETSNQVRLSALKLTVDLVDINNSGAGAISTATTGLIVLFSREYTRTDNINVRAIQTSGTTYAIPEVLDITTSGCTIKLKEAGTTYITGSISWTATGD